MTSMTYADLLDKKKYKMQGEVLVDKRSVWIVTPDYKSFVDPTKESRTIYVPAKLFKDLNRILLGMDGEKVVISFEADDESNKFIARDDAQKSSAINSKLIENLKLHLDSEEE